MSRDRFSWVEFVFVVVVALGWTIIYSVLAFASGRTVGEPGSGNLFGDNQLLAVVLQELIFFPIVAFVLYLKGWRTRDFPIGVSAAASIVGVAVAFTAWLLDGALTFLLTQNFSVVGVALQFLRDYVPLAPPSMFTVVSLSLVNPIYEEFIVCGYVIPALEGRFGTTTAINVSVAIRASYHLYQGLAAFPFHCMYGLLQAHIYVRWRRLWPLIVSHAILDFIAFTAFL